MTSGQLFQNGAKRMVAFMFHIYCKELLYNFFSNSTYFYVPQPKNNTSVSKKESDKLFLQIRLIKNKKPLHRN